MRYRCFGRTGIQMPVLSAGFMRSMQSWQDVSTGAIDHACQENFKAVAHAAFRHGINHFETARGYGSSERQLGQVIPTLPREEIILQTKIAPESDPETFIAHVYDSLRRLQVRRVDLLALHGINSFQDLWAACRPGGCLAAARVMQKQGLVGWVGFSGHGPTEVILEAIQHQMDDGFDYVNLHWYTIFQRHTKVLQQAAKRNLGVFIISPNDKGGKLYHPPEKLAALCAPLSPMQFNDLYCLARPEIHTISIGASSPADFTEHVEALPHLDEKDRIQQVYSRWQQAMRVGTGHNCPDAEWDRFPPFEEVPGYINIAFVFWLENLARGWDLLDYARERYALLGKEMRWVPGNTAADVNRLDLTETAMAANMEPGDLVGRLQRAHALLSGN